jgi:hypothetical protein
VICAALICGIIYGFFSDKSGIGETVKWVCGLIMTLTLISPLTGIHLQDLSYYFSGITADASDVTADGENMSRQELRRIIKQQLEAYILDKAEIYGAMLTVEVILNDDPMPAPQSVRIQGSISPYGKQRMIHMIQEELGIDTEDQLWSGV